MQLLEFYEYIFFTFFTPFFPEEIWILNGIMLLGLSVGCRIWFGSILDFPSWVVAPLFSLLILFTSSSTYFLVSTYFGNFTELPMRIQILCLVPALLVSLSLCIPFSKKVLQSSVIYLIISIILSSFTAYFAGYVGQIVISTIRQGESGLHDRTNREQYEIPKEFKPK